MLADSEVGQRVKPEPRRGQSTGIAITNPAKNVNVRRQTPTNAKTRSVRRSGGRVEESRDRRNMER